MEGKEGDRSDGDHYAEEHEGDEQGGSIGRFWRGLGDSKGVNEDIGEIEKRLHGFLRKLHLQMPGVHLFLEYAFAYRGCACSRRGRRLH
jgi:hypothetical protein